MGRRPDKSEFRAPVLLQNSDSERDDRFEQRLLGFCVTAQLDQLPHSRSWWAERLGISRSHMVKMTAEPSGEFISQFDLVVPEEIAVGDGTTISGQRLRPRLSDFYGDMLPHRLPANTESVLDWLARDPRILHESPGVAELLLRSEVAMKRCELLADSHDVDADPTVTQSLHDLMSLASGPYGGSTAAHQRCAEIGLLAPAAFFQVVTRHFNLSPVGFRLLRTLDRFVNIWRRRELDPALRRRGTTRLDGRLALLLVRLGRTAEQYRYLDPYPGGEWACTLARDCLATGRGLDEAEAWVQRAVTSSHCDRERVYAAWVARQHLDSARFDPLPTLAKSRSEYAVRWASILGDVDIAEGLTSSDVSDVFAEERRIVADAVMRHASEPSLSGVRDALESVILSALITPDGRLRRQLIEATVHAGLVSPASDILVEVAQELGADGPREAALFFLSRLRQPSPHVVDLFVRLSDDPDPAVSQVALWGMGDIYRARRSPAAVQAPFVEPLTRYAAGDTGAEIKELQLAAVHALSVMAWGNRASGAGPEEFPADDRDLRGAEEDSILAALRHAAQIGGEGPHGMVRAMANWGIAMHQQGQVIDPTLYASCGVPILD